MTEEATLPVWVYWLQALSTPAIAFAGVVIAWSGYMLSVRKRSDDLYPVRYELLRDVLAFLKSCPHIGEEEYEEQILVLTARFSFLMPKKYCGNFLNIFSGARSGKVSFQESAAKMQLLFAERIIGGK
jgi:hypothetical protein